MKETLSINLDEMLKRKDIFYIESHGKISKYKTKSSNYFYLVRKDDIDGYENYDYFETDDSFIVVSDFYDNRAIIKKNDKYGFIDNNFNIVIEPIYEEVKDFKEGFAAVKVNGKYGAIDLNGKITVSPEYDTFDSYSEGYAVISKDGLYNYVNNKGELLDKEVYYTSCTPFDFGFAHVKFHNIENIIYASNTARDKLKNCNLLDVKKKNNNFLIYNNCMTHFAINRQLNKSLGYDFIWILSNCAFGFTGLSRITHLNTNLEATKTPYVDLNIINDDSNEKDSYFVACENNDVYYHATFHNHTLHKELERCYGIIDSNLKVIIPVAYSKKELRKILNKNQEITVDDKTYIFKNGKINLKKEKKDCILINVNAKKVHNYLNFDIDIKEKSEKENLEEEIIVYLSKFKSEKLNNYFVSLNEKYSSKYEMLKKEDSDNKIKNNTNNNLTLSFDVKENPEDLYNEYISELKSFLEKLKNKKVYFDIIKEIEKCIDYVQSGFTYKEDEFYNDVNDLLNLYKKLDDTLIEKNKKVFIDKLKDDLNDINRYINDDTSINLNYKDINEWKNNFRNQLHILILHFKNDYDFQEIKQVIERRNNIIENLKGNRYNSVLRQYNTARKIIKETYSIIEKNESNYTDYKTKEYFESIKKQLKSLEDINISYNDNIEIISTLINDMLKNVIKLQIEMEIFFDVLKYDISKVSIQK